MAALGLSDETQNDKHGGKKKRKKAGKVCVILQDTKWDAYLPCLCFVSQKRLSVLDSALVVTDEKNPCRESLFLQNGPVDYFGYKKVIVQYSDIEGMDDGELLKKLWLVFDDYARRAWKEEVVYRTLSGQSETGNEG
jgi:hypothetical protein